MCDPTMDSGIHTRDASHTRDSGRQQLEPTAMETGGLAQLSPVIMDSGSHSSEEELEEYYLSPVSSGTEKRKWSDLSQSDDCYTPSLLQFSTSPPINVHKPRRSISPQRQQKLFSEYTLLEQQANKAPKRQNRLSSQHDASLTPSCSSSVSRHDYVNGLPALERQVDERRERRGISPRKRSQTSRACHIQRPCLDFEKMQQSNQEPPRSCT